MHRLENGKVVILNVDEEAEILREGQQWEVDRNRQLTAEVMEQKRRVADRVLGEERLEARDLDVDTPPEVEDYLSEKRR